MQKIIRKLPNLRNTGLEKNRFGLTFWKTGCGNIKSFRASNAEKKREKQGARQGRERKIE